MYPLRLLGTFVHELSHGLAAYASGGSLQRFVVNADLSGMAWSAGGVRWVVASAGYIGSAIFGALLLLLMRVVPARMLLFLLGAALAVLCLLYVRNTFGALSGLGLAAGLMLGGVLLRAAWSEALMLVIALQVLLDGFGSLLDLFTLSRGDQVHTDAHTLAQLSGLPAPFWAVLWALLAAAVAILVLRWVYRGQVPDGQGTDSAVNRSA